MGRGTGLEVKAPVRRAVRTIFTAQEIFVDNASYPTQEISYNSHLFRPIGLGYANLGALLMAFGLPYDSEEGRNVAAAVTALTCGHAYRTSAEIAEAMGPFTRYRMNRRSFLEVIDMHKAAVEEIDSSLIPEDLLASAREAWNRARTLRRSTSIGATAVKGCVMSPCS